MISPTEAPRRAFTLLEVLLVVALIGVMTLVSLPQMIRSIRGNRLRAATRTLVMAGRYARSMALLRQEEMALIFDLDQAVLRVESRGRPALQRSPEDGDIVSANDTPRPGTNAPPPTPVNLRRSLDAVRIASVRVQEESEHREGIFVVPYETNGRCAPYEVRLEDDHGGRMVIRVDALSSPQTERET